MSKLIGLFTLLLSLALITISPAYSQEMDQQQIEKLHEGLRQLKSTMEAALNSGDIDTILENVDEQVVFTTMNGDVVKGKKGIRDYFTDMMTGPDKIVEKVKSQFDVDDLSVIHGGDTAIALGDANDHYELTSGEAFDVKARWSGTMLLQDGRWVIGSFHYSTNMFDNPVLDMQRRYLTYIAIFLIALCSTISFFIGRKTGRKS